MGDGPVGGGNTAGTKAREAWRARTARLCGAVARTTDRLQGEPGLTQNSVAWGDVTCLCVWVFSGLVSQELWQAWTFKDRASRIEPFLRRFARHVTANAGRSEF